MRAKKRDMAQNETSLRSIINPILIPNAFSMYCNMAKIKTNK